MAGMWDLEEESAVVLGQVVTHRDRPLQPQGVFRAVPYSIRGSQRPGAQAEEEGACFHPALDRLSPDVLSAASTVLGPRIPETAAAPASGQMEVSCVGQM